jgi:hypothetical protein
VGCRRRLPSDGGLLAYRELDDALGLTAMGLSALAEGRRGTNIRHRLLGLLRQAVYGRLAGYEDVNDAERLARDPAMRAVVRDRVAGHRGEPRRAHGPVRHLDRSGTRAPAAFVDRGPAEQQGFGCRPSAHLGDIG